MLLCHELHELTLKICENFGINTGDLAALLRGYSLVSIVCSSNLTTSNRWFSCFILFPSLGKDIYSPKYASPFYVPQNAAK